MKSSSLPREPEAGGSCVISPFSGKPLGKTKVTNISERVRAWKEFYEPPFADADDNPDATTK
ncbi:MAG: hypothetical protein A3J72_09825 [Nitrospirae bacterium RIFCSPHIGHO2_02_FULL_40_19]|nr:MAG: hypothetical protein A3J72_09825 [Nitrospirae bacterium RIFCSPHIGHO2_02_FULL_40_19]